MGSQPSLHHCAHGLSLQSSHPDHCTKFQEVSHVYPVILPTLVSDAEDSDDEDEPDDATVRTTNAVADHFPFNTVDTAKPVTVEDPILPEDQAEFLRLHGRMGHSSFHPLQQMSKHGLLPLKFKKCRVPVCASCQQGKQHKKPWRTRADSSSPIGGPAIIEPGDCVSVDQLKSLTPGLISQVKGWLTRERHHTATVFVNHHSDLTFVHVTQVTPLRKLSLPRKPSSVSLLLMV